MANTTAQSEIDKIETKTFFPELKLSTNIQAYPSLGQTGALECR